MWFDKLKKSVQLTSSSPYVIQHLDENRERIIYTVELLRQLGLTGGRVCEIGFGGVGLACAQELRAKVDAYDCSEWFRPICEQFSIPWNYIDLNQPVVLSRSPYDAILLCEVIEHLCRWPAEVLADLGNSLKRGGVMFVTTPNLHRFSNRMRMLAGKRLFANFVPEDLLMAHLREYTPEELVFLFQRAGFSKVKWRLLAFDIGKPKWIETSYKIVCRAFPRLSNFIFCWGFKEK